MPSPKEIFSSINASMGIDQSQIDSEDDNEKSLSVSTYEPRRVVKASDSKNSATVEDQALLDDFCFAIASQQMLIESVGTALQEAIAAAIATASPEGFSAVASLTAQLNQAHKNLLELHRTAARANKEKREKDAGVKPSSPESVSQISQNPQPAQTQVFMAGTTEELIQMAKSLSKTPVEIKQ